MSPNSAELSKFKVLIIILTAQQFQRYLKDNDFKDIFGMSLEEYDLLPQWKRLRLKKSVNLF